MCFLKQTVFCRHSLGPSCVGIIAIHPLKDLQKHGIFIHPGFFGITGGSGYTDSSLVWVVEFCRFPSSTVKRGYSKGVVTLHQTIGRESVHPKPKQKSLLEIFPGIVELKKPGRRSSQIPPAEGREFEGGNGAAWHGLYLVTG